MPITQRSAHDWPCTVVFVLVRFPAETGRNQHTRTEVWKNVSIWRERRVSHHTAVSPPCTGMQSHSERTLAQMPHTPMPLRGIGIPGKVGKEYTRGQEVRGCEEYRDGDTHVDAARSRAASPKQGSSSRSPSPSISFSRSGPARGMTTYVALMHSGQKAFQHQVKKKRTADEVI